MSCALDVPSCRRDGRSSAAHEHLILCLSCGIYVLETNACANCNRGTLIHTTDKEVVGKSDVLKVSRPKKERIFCGRTA